MSNEELKIENVTEEDKLWIREFLRQNFCVDEPITDYLKIAENPSALATFEKFTTKNLNQNLSFVVRDGDGKLLGVCINSIKSKHDEDEEVTDPLFGKIANLLGYAYEEARVFEKFPDVDKVMYIDVISVNKSAGGRGLGTMMVNRTKELARQRGIKLLRVDCTSHYSARASEKLGLECVYELKYSDYKVNGEQVFNPGAPHTGVKVYVQRLDK